RGSDTWSGGDGPEVVRRRGRVFTTGSAVPVTGVARRRRGVFGCGRLGHEDRLRRPQAGSLPFLPLPKKAVIPIRGGAHEGSRSAQARNGSRPRSHPEIPVVRGTLRPHVPL